MDTDSALEISDSFPFATNLTDELEQEGIIAELLTIFFENFRISN